MSQTLREISEQLKDSTKKIQLIYAFNGTGKTRLSRDFKQLVVPSAGGDEIEVEQLELSRNKILYFNAFTEDLFYWDNDLEEDSAPKLKVQKNSFTDWIIRDRGQDQNIITNFQRYTDDKLTPAFIEQVRQETVNGRRIAVKTYPEVHFTFDRGSERSPNVKISKGEESNFVWSIFFTLLQEVISILEEPAPNQREDDQFNQLEYVFIDDPVSSLDDNHLIELAVNLAKLIKSSTAQLKFIITTHNPLFYNVLSNEFNNKLAKDPSVEPVEWLYKPRESEKSRLDKKVDGTFVLTTLGRKTPFSYHLLLLSEIREAINDNQVKKFHFNFLRNILEKTTTFLGHDKWEDLLPQDSDGNVDPFANRILNLSSHSAHAGEETGEVTDNDKDKLEELLNFLSSEYGFWQQEAQND
jgi:wobble nucleotide-excising tRNase